MTSFSDLRFFCDHIIRNYGSPHLLSEEQMAEEFRSVYLRNLPINLNTLKAVASACDINLDSLEGDKMPENVRGYHEVYNGRRNIYYKKGDTISGIENTILHEFREMIEPVFADTCPDYEPLRTIALHLAANSFATAVLLPRDEFEEKVYETGFDVIALSSLYSKSCSQVLLRMGEVLHGRIFFYAALYEKDDSAESDWRVTYWTGSYNEDCPEANLYGTDRLFPRKGHQVMPDSPVAMVIKTGRTHLIEHITLFEDTEDSGLTAIAQPLALPGAKPSKVALIMMLKSDSQKLEPQVERTKPLVIEKLHVSTIGKEFKYEYGT